MNIFRLDETPELSAKYHCDKHCVKMILESAQMLSTTHHFHNSRFKHLVYRPTHKHHPCNLWCRETSENYKWLFKLFNSLLLEYQKRYKKQHKCWALIKYLAYNPCPKGELTPFAQAMPDQYKDEDSVKAYRDYYIGEKSYFSIWRYTSRPYWFPSNTPV